MMRLERLGLVRYGHFTDAVLTLPPPMPGAPDLHVVYGPNEAGKSTLLSAWLDLLFGIPNQSSYAFMHDSAALRIEARLRLGATQLDVARVKGRSGTLLDADDRVLPEAALAGALGGLDRASYTTMFSLDDDTLEAGGDSILASRGDLGQLLFSASAGLSDLSADLASLQQGVDGFFRPGARKFRLAELKSELREIDAQRQAHDVQVSSYQRLVQARDSAQSDYARARADLLRDRALLAALERQRAALPKLARWQRLRTERAALPPINTDLPAEWVARVAELREEAAQLAALHPRARDACTALRDRRATLTADPDAAALAPRIEEMDHKLGVWLKQRSDLPNRRIEVQQIDRRMADICTSLGQPDADPRALLLPARMLGALAERMEARAALDRSLAEAEAELREARSALAAARAEAEATPAAAAPAEALAQLAALIPDLRAADPEARARRARAECATAEAALAHALAALAPWSGDARMLAAMSPPSPAWLRAFTKRLDAAQIAQRDAEAECARLGGAVARRSAALGDDARPDGAADSSTARQRRDAAWQAHLAALTPETARRFEDALRVDDAVTQVRLVMAEAAARALHQRSELAQERAALAEADASLERARATIEALQAEFTATVHGFWPGCDHAITPGAVLEWLEMRCTALKCSETLEAARRAATDAEAERDAARARLGAALAAAHAPVTGDLAADLARAQTLVDAGARSEARAEALRKAVTAEARRKARHLAVHDEIAAWQADWEHLCSESWLGSVSPSVAEIRVITEALRELAPLVSDARGLRDRITKIDRDQQVLASELAALADVLGTPADAEPPQLWHRLRQRIEAAAQTERILAELAAETAEAESQLAALAARAARLEAETAPMLSRLGVTDLPAAAEALARAGRAGELDARGAEAWQDLCAALGQPRDMDSAVSDLEGCDADALAAEADTLAATVRAQETAVAESYAMLRQAQAALDAIGGDDAAARLEERRQTVLLELTDAARDWLRQSIGIRAVESALLRHRDTHRSGMLEQAAAAFRTLTGGEYAGLVTRPDRGREVLIAQRATGAGVAVERLSKGTRFQLYLALRIAGYHEFAAAHAAVPFVADDIMETFDDARAGAAFALLAEMSRKGQVIYLTHHAHLCALARRSCPTVTVHDLARLQSGE